MPQGPRDTPRHGDGVSVQGRAEGESPRLDSVEDFELTQYVEYPREARTELSDEDRRRLEELTARVVERFQNETVELTAFPSRAAHILRVLDEPNFDIGQLVQITQRDPVISASILRAANSAAFAGVGRIEGVRDAVVRLGAQTVAGIATAVTARGLFDEGARMTRSQFGDTWSRLWLHSVTTAFAAGGFASSARMSANLERCFLGGMLHDIGKTFVLRTLGGLAVEDETKSGISPPLLAAILEGLHVQMGKTVAAGWNLPDFVVEACADHHEPASAENRELNIIRVVSGIDEISVNPHYRSGLEEEVRRSARSLGLDGYALRALAAERRDYAAKAAAL